ncbi:hypothetical protein [Streptomyces olivoreticuli]|uniref:hypothetical protein n=1 Tax=Streptomyces olivoreticuli TaxID=68246 RepID=UPI000E26D39F|nr:hypothetical protein [Streptomyces olivoreticuli]
MTTTTPPCDTLNVGAITRDISRGLAPRGEPALRELEDQLRTHIEALIPFVEEEGKKRGGRFGGAVQESAAMRGRRLLSSRTIDTDPSPAPERVVFALAHAARSLLLFAGLR